jgi:soluble lytic murein transglycosylase-like protein
MSTIALTGAGGELAVAERVQQLQSLIEQARQSLDGALPSTAGSSATTSYANAPATAQPTDFATALQAASAADASPVSYQASSEPLTGTSAQSSQYDELIEAAAQRNGIEPAVLHGLIQQESGFDASAQSSAGASGLTQLMPGTAASMGVANPLDPAESIEGGARYLGQLMRQFSGNTTEALAAYNAGPGAVEQYGGVPPYAETESYVSKVLGYAESFRASQPAPSTVGALT